MERSHVLGLMCGYYLSRFDGGAYDSLHLGNKTQTHAAIARALGVPPLSLKNWRDEFDPAHENSRQGWHNREMRASRVKAIAILSRYSQEEIHGWVTGCIDDPNGPDAQKVLDLLGGLEPAG